jgi:ADP-dependent NAD(P)H-hydrate dehydratase
MSHMLEMIDRVPAAPARDDAGHKGTFGTVVVVGGSETMIGAPALVAMGAMRSGVGLVKAVVPRGIIGGVIAIEPGVTAIDWWNGEARGGAAGEGANGEVGATFVRDDETIDAGLLAGAMARVDARRRAVLAVGPGLGVTEASGAVVAWALHGPRAVVLDADGLSALAAMDRGAVTRGDGPLVMTPHPGEFARLAKAYGLPEAMAAYAAGTDEKRRVEAASELARAATCVVVLKGRHSVVTDGTRVFVNQTGNPAMATAGSGDVLTGVIAALLAQGMAALDAAILGVNLHGSAGDLWAGAHGKSGLTARDLAGQLPDAFEHARRA